MEEHPQFAALVQWLGRWGFKLDSTGQEAFTAVLEFVDGEDRMRIVKIDKIIHIPKGSRYLDLEHELDHVKQLVFRLGTRLPDGTRLIYPTERWVILGARSKRIDGKGTLTFWQNTITEYHVRLREIIRLHRRGAEESLLREHAESMPDFREKYRTTMDKDFSRTRSIWRDKYFPDLILLVEAYNHIGGRNLES